MASTARASLDPLPAPALGQQESRVVGLAVAHADLHEGAVAYLDAAVDLPEDPVLAVLREHLVLVPIEAFRGSIARVLQQPVDVLLLKQALHIVELLRERALQGAELAEERQPAVEASSEVAERHWRAGWGGHGAGRAFLVRPDGGAKLSRPLLRRNSVKRGCPD
jgi:hypothetical protein